MTNKAKLFLGGFLVLTIVLGVASFSNDESEETNQEDVTTKVPDDGSVESYISVEHINDSFDVLITKHQIWNGGKVSKTALHYDTIPTLGKTFVQAEDGEGNTKDAYVNKDYEIYITVK